MASKSDVLFHVLVGSIFAPLTRTHHLYQCRLFLISTQFDALCPSLVGLKGIKLFILVFQEEHHTISGIIVKVGGSPFVSIDTGCRHFI